MSVLHLAAISVRSVALASLIISPHSAASTAEAALMADGVTQAQAQQPRDPRSDIPRPETQREQELKAATAAEPTKVTNWLELARLQEARGALEEVERTFDLASQAVGPNLEVLKTTADFFNRTGRFDRTVAALEAFADVNPSDPTGHQLLATYYREKVAKDATLSPADKLKYLDAGIAATDRALAQKPEFIDALVYKNILLRMKANLEPDAVLRTAMLAEADALRNQALELSKTQNPAAAPPGAPGAPAPPPPPGAPLRVGGNIKAPARIHHVNPVYPQEALDARVGGMVILEATIDEQGNVSAAKVLRSIPLLDQAAVDAVRAWRFTPTLLNGTPVPVIMTVTVNFSPQ